MIDFSSLALRESAFWRWSLHHNQCYPGRIVIALNRPCIASLTALDRREFLDLQRQLRDFEAVIDALFQPDRFNYSQLGNEWAQLHVHAIPRYRRPRRWNDVVFRDKRWGRNPSPKDESPLDHRQLLQFVQWLRGELDRRLGRCDLQDRQERQERRSLP